MGDSLALDHHVIAIDERGAGQSTKSGMSSDYGPAMAQDVMGVLDHLHLTRAHLVGHSLGAVIAAYVATHHPNRVESVSLLAGAHFPDSASFAAITEPYVQALEMFEQENSEEHDPFATGRYQRVATLSSRVAEAVGLRGREVSWLRVAAYLYDLGRSRVPPAILNKPGALTPDEWEIMKQHPLASEEIAADLGFPEEIRPAIRHHHERWDGSGYPAGLRGEEIPMLARILALGDVYDALTSDRPYRPAFPPDDALTIMHAEAGRKLDPELFRVFRTVVAAGSARPASAREAQQSAHIR